MTEKAEQWEVRDGYGKTWCSGTLRECGVWIDPVLGIELPGVSFGWTPGIDNDRFTVNEDGTITVYNYTDSASGAGGEFTLVRVMCECNGGDPCDCPDCDHVDCSYQQDSE